MRKQWALLGAAVVLAATPLMAQKATKAAAATAAPTDRGATAARISNAVGFSVESFTPQGNAMRDDSIVVTFSSDLPADVTQNPRALSSIVSFEPGIDATWSFESPRRLRIAPRGALRSATAYTARVSPLLRDAAGNALSGTTSFSFHTAPLRVTGITQQGFSADRRVSIEITFSDPVVPADLRKYVSVLADGKPVKWATLSDTRSTGLRIQTDPLPALKSALSVRVESGLPTVSGPLGLEAAVDKRLPINFTLTATQLSATWSGEKPTLELSFSNSVTGDVKSQLSVQPAVPFELEMNGSSVELKGDFKAGERYTVTVGKNIKGSNGGVTGKVTELSTWIPAMKPFVEMKDAGGQLSTAGRMKVPVRYAGVDRLRVTAYRVYDSNVPTMVILENSYELPRFSKRVLDKTISVTRTDKAAGTELDLKELLKDGSGLYRLELVGLLAAQDDNSPSYEYDNSWGRNRLRDDAQITLSNLGVTAKRGPHELLLWVTALDTAKPVAGAKVSVFSKKLQPVGTAETDKLGVATFTDPGFAGEKKPALVQVSANNEIVHLDLSQTLSGAEELQSSGRPFLTAGYEAFAAVERGAYRPGETVRVFGHVRDRNGQAPGKSFPLKLVVKRPDGRTLPSRLVTPNATGYFETTIATASYSPTGLYRASLSIPKPASSEDVDSSDEDENADVSEEDSEELGPDGINNVTLDKSEIGATEFFVEDFIPNRLKVSAKAAESGLGLGKPFEVSVAAEEMFGQPAGGRPVDGTAFFRAYPYEPKSFAGYRFGDEDTQYTRVEQQIDPVELGEDGRGTVSVSLPETRPESALKATVQVNVKDVGGRGVSARVERLVHPTPYYLGASAPTTGFVATDKEATFELVAVKPTGDNQTPEGKWSSDAALFTEDVNLSTTLYRVLWNSTLTREDGRFEYKSTRELLPVEEKQITLSGGKAKFEFTPKTSGAYLLTAESKDEAKVRLGYAFYASNGRWEDQSWSMEKPERLELSADKDSYSVGDVARIVVKAPFAGTLLTTREQDGARKPEVTVMDTNTVELKVPIEATDLPHLYIGASLIRPVTPAGRWLPHRAFGMIPLKLNPKDRKLDVALSAPSELRPGTTLLAEAKVSDSEGKALKNAQVSLWAVDEGILDLTAYKTPDPLNFFYSARKLGVVTADVFGNLMPDIDPAKASSAPGGGEAAERRLTSPVPADRVKPVALWLGTISTDENGVAKGEAKVPTYFGRLRLMAIAAESGNYGHGDRTVFVRDKVLVKDGLPRFASPGDQVFVPFTIYNNTQAFADMAIDVKATGALKPVAIGRWLSKSADEGATRVNLETTATGMAARTHIAEFQVGENCGVSKVTFGGSLDSSTYSDTINVPVRPANLYTRLTGIDTVEPGSESSIGLPGNFFPGTTSATLIVSALPTLSLAPALLEVVDYPYGCAEQTISRAFPLLYLKDLAAAIDTKRFSEDGVTLWVQNAIDRLLTMQNSNGHIAMWPGGWADNEFATVYAAHFLVEAKKAGFEVPEESLKSLMTAVGNIADTNEDNNDARTLACYAVYVQAANGEANRSRMESLADSNKGLTLEARANLAAAYARAGDVKRARSLLKSDGKDAEESQRELGGIFSSPTRTTALLLAAWLEADPTASEVPGLVKRLEKQTNKHGHFGNTQENAFALFALGKFAKTLSQQNAGLPEGKVTLSSGRELTVSGKNAVTVSGEELLGTTPTISIKSGSGRAYVCWAVSGVPLKLAASETSVSRGLLVSRRFLDRQGNVLNPRKLTQGQYVVVEIRVSGERADNVAVEDLLPAGLEVENPNLATSEQKDDSGESSSRGNSVRVEVRDDRVVAFLEDGGNQTIRYGARAVTAGTFQQGPVQATAMYDPDVMARSGAQTVTVAPKRNVTPAPLP